MSAVTGTEPHWWHDAGGCHKMTDPRTIRGYNERWWDMDERAFVTHLKTHEGERKDPAPTAEDSPRVRQLFELMEARLKEVDTMKELIWAIRQSEAFSKSSS